MIADIQNRLSDLDFEGKRLALMARRTGSISVLMAPKGPSDERKCSCPGCKSSNIERVNIVKSQACPPGG